LASSPGSPGGRFATRRCSCASSPRRPNALSTPGGRRSAARSPGGFLLKDVPADQLVAGIRLVAQGDALLAPSVTRRLIHEFSRSARGRRERPAGLDELTPRELEVFQLLARGMSNAEIAADLIVSETTVKTHVAWILMKLEVRDRVQAVVLAYESGVIAPGDGG
jgi:DNA-binding NarL/FixJ family response regulator